MLGLGIESSCDETSVAVVRDGCEPLANVIFSQIEAHARFRGVVPEIASRAHLEKLNFIYAEALAQSGARPQDLDYVSVSVRPGLTGSLMIGAALAKSLALCYELPVILADHLIAHMYAPCLEGWRPEYPFLGLLLSGGNSAVYRVETPTRMIALGDTRDDACGEAFDKIASILGLGYPGGPAIEACAEEWAARQTPPPRWTETTSLFPRLLRNLPGDRIAFSYSGVKTAAARAFREGQAAGRICFDFQHVAFELAERNLRRAAAQTGLRTIVASGGVLANGFLRRRLDALAEREGLRIVYPQKRFHCTDNAGMVAAAGYYLRGTELETRRLDFAVDSKRYLPAADASGPL